MTLTANGIDLSTLAYNVASLTGRLTSPQRRGKDIEVPGRHGAIRTPGKKFAANTVVLPMWVIGTEEDGDVSNGVTNQELLHDNVDRLVRLFSTDTVELVYTPPGGTARRISGQVMEAIDFSSQAGGTRAEFAVALSVAGAFWEDVAQVVANKTGTGVWAVAEFTGATAPMDDTLIRFTAPATNPRLTSPSGVFVAYNAALSSSQWVEINCATWEVVGGSGLTASYSALDHGGDPRWFVMDPGDPVPQVTASQTAGSTGGFRITGRRKYMVA